MKQITGELADILGEAERYAKEGNVPSMVDAARKAAGASEQDITYLVRDILVKGYEKAIDTTEMRIREAMQNGDVDTVREAQERLVAYRLEACLLGRQESKSRLGRVWDGARSYFFAPLGIATFLFGVAAAPGVYDHKANWEWVGPTPAAVETNADDSLPERLYKTAESCLGCHGRKKAKDPNWKYTGK